MPKDTLGRGALNQSCKIREGFLEEATAQLKPWASFKTNPGPHLVCLCSLLLILTAWLSTRATQQSSFCWACLTPIPQASFISESLSSTPCQAPSGSFRKLITTV